MKMRVIILVLFLCFAFAVPAQAQYVTYNLMGLGGNPWWDRGFQSFPNQSQAFRTDIGSNQMMGRLGQTALISLPAAAVLWHAISSSEEKARIQQAGGGSYYGQIGWPTERHMVETREVRYEEPPAKRAKPEIPAKKIGEGTWLVPTGVEVDNGDWKIEGIGVVKGVPEEKRILELEKAVEELKKQQQEKTSQSSFNDRPPTALLASSELIIHQARIEPPSNDNQLYKMDEPTAEPRSNGRTWGKVVKFPDGKFWREFWDPSGRHGYQPVENRY